MKILHLEDSTNDAELFAEVLRREWPEIEIQQVVTAQEFTRAVTKGGFDLILSDNSLPDIDGLTALELARRWCPQTPFVFLSGTIGEEKAVEALRRGALDYVIKDRPARLAAAVRQALLRRDEQVRQLREDRMESIGMMAGGVVHDLNNILAPILAAAQLLKTHGQRSDFGDRMLTMIETSAQHGAELIKQLLAFARGTEGPRAELRVDQQLAHLELMLKPTLGQGIKLRLTFPEPPWPILADATQFNQVILNLCVNARDAMPDGGRIEISTQNLILSARSSRDPEARSGPYLRVSVADTGTGIAPDIITKIFDPFFTTKAAGKGTGLGLSTVREIIQNHGGFLRIESEVGKGSTFHLHFPTMPPDSSLGSS